MILPLGGYRHVGGTVSLVMATWMSFVGLALGRAAFSPYVIPSFRENKNII